MHRSGTSATTRLINMLGPALSAPDDLVRGAWNPSGHWESRSLIHLDDNLLRQMGRTWWYPPPGGAMPLPIKRICSLPTSRNTKSRHSKW